MQALLSGLIRQQHPALDAALRWRLTPMAIKQFAAAAETATDVQSAAGKKRRPAACLDLTLHAGDIFLTCSVFPAGTNGSRWWQDPSLDATQAQAVFRQRLHAHGAQGELQDTVNWAAVCWQLIWDVHSAGALPN